MNPKSAMIQRTRRTGEKWFNSPVTYHLGSLNDIGSHIPTFERRAFTLPKTGQDESGVNSRLDTIVRLPFSEEKSAIPVGVVSKDYALVQHSDVLKVMSQALKEAKIEGSNVQAELKITEYGERMALSLRLPSEHNFDPGDGHPMALRLECWNSVDGSTRFRALMGWFRFVCSNGLVVGVTRSDLHRRHVGEFRVEDIGVVLRSGLSEVEAERARLKKWRETSTDLGRLAAWCNGALRKEWNFKAAARAYHIARTGMDAEVIGKYAGSAPAGIAMLATVPVHGSPQKSENLFDVSQILAWLAKERRDLHEQLQWREAIPELMQPLMHR